MIFIYKQIHSCLPDYYILSYPTWLNLILSKIFWNLSLNFVFVVFRAENLFILRWSGLVWNVDRPSSPSWKSSTPPSSMFPYPIAMLRIHKRKYLNISWLLLRILVWHLVLYLSFCPSEVHALPGWRLKKSGLLFRKLSVSLALLAHHSSLNLANFISQEP